MAVSALRCARCGGELVRGATTHRMTRAGYTLSVSELPAWVCAQCGQALLGDEQNDTLREIAAYLDDRVQWLRRDWHA
ncbi:MAG: YgiT-type zinc finger protein [Chloroflexi bacterium]|nr:YgiT-type zinc finger protein [Chloroflexota bacterium]